MARRDIRIKRKGFFLVFVSPYCNKLFRLKMSFFNDNRDNNDNREIMILLYYVW